MNRRNQIRVWVIFLISICLIVMPHSVLSQGLTARVYIDPSQSSAATCGTHQIAVNVEDVANLTAYHLEISFDPTVVEVLDVENGAFLSEPADVAYFYEPTNEIDNENGKIIFGMAQQGVEDNPLVEPQSGSGSLIVITLQALVPNDSTLFVIDDVASHMVEWPSVLPIEFTTTDGEVSTESCAPTDIALSNATIPENEPVSTLVGNFSATDADTGDTLVYTLVDTTTYPDNARFTIDGTALRSAIVFDFEDRDPSDYTIFVRVTDFGGKFFEEAFVISVTDVNEAPEAVNDTYSTLKNEPLIVDAPGVLSNDTDVDLDSLSAIKVSNPPSGEGTVVLAADGEFSYFPPAGWTGSTSFTYYASDGSLPSNTATVTINVNETNDPPTDITLTPTSLAENLPIGSAVGTFGTVDPDNPGDSFVYTLVSGAGNDDNAQFSISGGTLVSGAVFDYETKNTYSIRVRSTDQGSLWTEKSFTINITDANDAPVAYDQNLETDQGTPIEITLEGYDQDGDTFDFALVGASPLHGSMPWTPPVLTYSPEVSFKGVDSFKYRVIDEHGASSNTATITIKVIGDFCLEVEPVSLSQTLEVGTTDSQTLTLTNTCGYDVPFSTDKIGIFDFEEGFEEGLMPPSGGWETVHNGTTGNVWGITTIPAAVYEGNYAAFINWDATNPSDEWLLTPVINATDAANLELSFWAYSNINYPTATMQVWVADENGNVITDFSTEPLWDMVRDESWAANALREVNVDLSDFDGYGLIRIVWRYVGVNGTGFALDNVNITSTLPALWLSIDPSGATINSFETLPINVIFDANSLDVGEYLAGVSIINEPYPILSVQVTLDVNASGTNYFYLPLVIK